MHFLLLCVALACKTFPLLSATHASSFLIDAYKRVVNRLKFSYLFYKLRGNFIGKKPNEFFELGALTARISTSHPFVHVSSSTFFFAYDCLKAYTITRTKMYEQINSKAFRLNQLSFCCCCLAPFAHKCIHLSFVPAACLCFAVFFVRCKLFLVKGLSSSWHRTLDSFTIKENIFI